MNLSTRIAAVIVTHNRLHLLQRCIDALRNQSCSLGEILVIDNASDDGTREWLCEQKDVSPIFQTNLGGAGGFHAGIKAAYERGHQWFWCMDDDTFADPSALSAMCNCPEFSDPETGFLSSLVKWKDGNLHLMNLPKIWCYSGWIDQVLQSRTIPVLASSFVSIMISREAVKRCGYPLHEMFIWSDDVEYTRRISNLLPCRVCLESVAVHATPANATDSLETLTALNLWKFRHGYRNSAFLLATGPESAFFKCRNLLRQIAELSRMLFKLRKPQFLAPLVAASLRGFFTFRPRIEYPD